MDASPTATLGYGFTGFGGNLNWFQSAWNWISNTTSTPVLAGLTTSETVWKFDFLVAGTSTPVFINVIPNTIDNDGVGNIPSSPMIALNEEVVYFPTPADYSFSNTTLQTQLGNTITGPAEPQPGIGTNSNFIVFAYYYNVSSVTWTSRNKINNRANSYAVGASGRLSVLT